MNNYWFRNLVFLGVGFCANAFAAVYRIEPSFPGGTPRPGEEGILQFSIYRDAAVAAVTAEELRVEHEKKIHLFMLDSGFQEFLHVHPEELSPGVWQVPFRINTAGEYRVWVEFKPISEEKTQRPTFDVKVVSGDTQTYPHKPVNDAVTLTAVTGGGYKVTLQLPNGDPVQHGMTDLAFTVEKDGVVIPGTARAGNFRLPNSPGGVCPG